jgi:hypothetical protein
LSLLCFNKRVMLKKVNKTGLRRISKGSKVVASTNTALKWAQNQPLLACTSDHRLHVCNFFNFGTSVFFSIFYSFLFVFHLFHYSNLSKWIQIFISCMVFTSTSLNLEYCPQYSFLLLDLLFLLVIRSSLGKIM